MIRIYYILCHKIWTYEVLQIIIIEGWDLNMREIVMKDYFELGEYKKKMNGK